MKSYLSVSKWGSFLFLVAMVGVTSPGMSAEQTKTGKNPVVVMTTSKGDIKIELFQDKAPISVENFLKYVKDKHYDGTVFHRVISNFMIQGGGMNAKLEEKKGRAPIKNEATNGLSNTKGTVAMARTNVVDSATAQFYINVADNTFLNHRSTRPDEYGYAVFGKVIEGMNVVDAIKGVPTGNQGMYQDVPKEAVEIKSVKLVEADAKKEAAPKPSATPDAKATPKAQ